MCGIKNKKRKPQRPNIKVGDVYQTNNYGEIRVLEKIKNTKRYRVSFLNSGFCTEAQTKEIHSGNIRDISQVKVFGDAVIGDAFSSRDTYSKTIEYNYWMRMLTRCKYHKDDEYYNKFSIDERWLNFSNFYKDAKNLSGYKDMISNPNIKYSLDKDMIIHGNNIYSRDACCFIPQDINTYVQNTYNKGGYCFSGVYKYKNRFISSIRINKKTQELYRGLNPILAHEIYWDKKEDIFNNEMIVNDFNFLSKDIINIVNNKLKIKREESLRELNRALDDNYFK